MGKCPSAGAGIGPPGRTRRADGLQRVGRCAGTEVAGLTRAQFSVLRLVAEGMSNAAVAARLHISERSVESHLLSIYRRLGIAADGRNRRVSAVLTFLEQTGRTWHR
nr:helix-turn-helix transcriptional regulator [Microbacterium halophytorum]